MKRFLHYRGVAEVGGVERHVDISLLEQPQVGDYVIVQRASAVVLTKLDLMPYLDWDLELCRQHLETVHPGITCFPLSVRTGDGLTTWTEYLVRLAHGN